MKTAILWFRSDLRLSDNPALFEAARQSYKIIPVFIWAPDEESPWQPGAASRTWLHHSLAALQTQLEADGLRLILRKGPSLRTLEDLIRQTGAATVFFNRRYEPAVRKRDEAIIKKLRVETFKDALLFEPWEVKPYKIYTAFWNKVRTLEVSKPLPAPSKLLAPDKWPQSLSLKDLDLLPKKLDWANRMMKHWKVGEKAAQKNFKAFMEHVAQYSKQRDIPSIQGTSQMSPALHFGEISARQIWWFLTRNPNSLPYQRQIIWREFSYHLLHHFPHTPKKPLREEFQNFKWKQNKKLLRAWQQGRTGYPLVDAGMRELYATGWMHNRVRMVAASFLVKHLLQPWQEGAKWFWDTLVDADLANNTMGWQWVAGCGADAAPFFRIFNPTLQAEKFDPDGHYIRRWVPELKEAPEKYPAPIVDHAEARKVALLSYETMRK